MVKLMWPKICETDEFSDSFSKYCSADSRIGGNGVTFWYDDSRAVSNVSVVSEPLQLSCLLGKKFL